MGEVIPLFKSHYSIGRSILTLEEDLPEKGSGPDSIIDICVKENLSKLSLVEDNMSGFLQAYLNCKDKDIDLIFGLRIGVTDDCEEKTPESLGKTCKYIVFAKNNNGYKKLIKIYSHASKHGFYYYPRTDFASLKKFWSNRDLQLCVPFYDSFIFKNTLESSNCVPELEGFNPIFFTEDNNLPFDNLIMKRVQSFCSDQYQMQKTKSIFYRNRKDFKSYLTFKCINNRTTLDRPNFDHMCSDDFCFESWKEQVA
jgi:DNA polymerase III alpha subunit